MTNITMHPVQATRISAASSVITLRAYEVYAKIHGEQPALVTGGCRGGFSTGELLAFLYAHSFPEREWAYRAAEALHGISSERWRGA